MTTDPDCDAIADDVVTQGIAPSAAAAAGALVADGGELVAETGGARGTYFDLASLTKPMTAVAVLRAGLDLGSPLGEHLPELRGTASGDVPLELYRAPRRPEGDGADSSPDGGRRGRSGGRPHDHRQRAAPGAPP